MKKIIYYLCFLILLFIISILPISAKEIKTCTRSTNNLMVKEELITESNINDILTTPCVDDIVKVYDFADLLTDLEEDKLYNEVTNYINNTNYDLIIVTTNNHQKEDAKSYADDFYYYNSFGKNKTRDGVLLLIDMMTRELYISTSGYAIKMYDDDRIESILDSGYLHLTNQEYYDTFSNMIISLETFYDLDYPSSNDNLIIDEFGNSSYIKKIPYGLVIFISLIITSVVALVLYFMSRLKLKVGSAINYLSKKEITNRKDDLVNVFVTHTRRHSDSSSSRGITLSGGSSFHTSSSGRSHGGGGRKF